MPRAVARRDGVVVAAPHHALARMDEDAADRDLLRVERELGLLESLAHEGVVV